MARVLGLGEGGGRGPSEVQGHLQPHNKLEACLAYVKPCVKATKIKQTNKQPLKPLEKRNEGGLRKRPMLLGVSGFRRCISGCKMFLILEAEQTIISIQLVLHEPMDLAASILKKLWQQ